MNLEDLKRHYDELQLKYGANELNPIYNGGCDKNPDICFVFMNPTKRNIASSKDWQGLKAPWIGTKNIWDLFYKIGLLDDDIYTRIRSIKSTEWTEKFADEVYSNVKKYKYFITNLGKCTQIDARELPDSIFKEYLSLFKKEINGKEYDCYSVFYPVVNGRFNMDKSIEDILYIKDNLYDDEIMQILVG